MNMGKTLSVRTDLAYDERNKVEDSLSEEIKIVNNIKVYKHTINEIYSQMLNKKRGTYYTFDFECADIKDTKTAINIEKALSCELRNIINDLNLKNKKCLVVGLGNMSVTPDALGPCVIDNIIVTRHLFELNSISEGFSNVSAISPGVMGTTGIETFDIISSIVKKINCDYIIVVDALVTSSVSRVNKTIQIADSGINPGSGVGNKRKELSYETLGIPVIAIGVPTVVDSVTITLNTLQHLFNHLEENDNVNLINDFSKLSDNERKNLIKKSLEQNDANMIVTPKDIDESIEDLANIIGNAINLTLHDGLFNGLSE